MTRKKQSFLIWTKRTMKLVLILAVFFIFYSFGIAVVENMHVNREVQAFKDRAVFVKEELFLYRSGVVQHRKYYEVPRETSYELLDKRPVFTHDNRRLLGQKGDIFVTQESPFPHLFGIHQFITYYFGGHAAIHNGINGFIEATGFPEGDETVLKIMLHRGQNPHNYSVTAKNTQTNYWLEPQFRDETAAEYPYYGPYYRNHFMILRVKDITEEEIDRVVDYALDQVDVALYNFLFALDMTYKYYCTDLVSRAYQHVLVEPNKQREFSRALNDDGFITSVNDLILSKQTYLVAYVEVIDNVFHIYYLQDIE